MTCTLGIGRPRGSAPILALCALTVAAACSTDVEYLRAGNIPSSGTEAGEGSAGGGGDGGASGSSSEDAGDDGAPDAPEGDGGAGGSGGSGGAAPDAAEAGLPPPTGFRLGVPSTSDTISPSAGGMNYTDICPTSGVAIGVKATADATNLANLKSLALVCGTLGISGKGPYQVTTTLAGQLPTRGDLVGTMMQAPMCPPNQVIVGFESKTATYMEQISFRCAPLTIAEGPQGYALSVGMSMPILPVGGPGGTPQRSVSCPNGAVAAGSVLRAGNAIDAFALACASPALTFTQ
jgi:hypothetical protein